MYWNGVQIGLIIGILCPNLLILPVRNRVPARGNVLEWCSDWADYWDSLSESVDPTGPESGSRKVLRGGSWGSEARNTRSAFHFSMDPRHCSAFIGFRVLFPI
jgi:Uncharacterized conserved protein